MAAEPAIQTTKRATNPPRQGGLRLLFSAFAGVLVWFVAMSLPHEQRLVGSVFAATVVAWITEALPPAVTALVSTTLLILLGGAKEKEAFAAYGEPTILLFVGSFLLAKAMEINGLAQRLAWWVLKHRLLSSSASRLVLAVGVISCVLSLFVSNTAVAAMLLPVVGSIVVATGSRGGKLSTALMLMLSWGATVAVGVPVGTPPNLIGIDLIEKATHRQITFLEWMAFAMPITAVMVIVGWLLLRRLEIKESIDTSAVAELASSELKALPPLQGAERNTLFAFFLTLIMWLLPDSAAIFYKLVQGKVPEAVDRLQDHLTPAVAAILGASLLFVLPARERESGRTLTWKEGVTIDWGIILLFGGGIALGQAMSSSGLARTLGDLIVRLTGAESLWSLTAICIAAAILLSELASNTAAATILVPVAMGLAEGAGVSPIAPALGAALGASFGFMLPVSTPPNAIVYSSGLVTTGQMARRGFFVDVCAFIVIFLILRLVLPMLHLA